MKTNRLSGFAFVSGVCGIAGLLFVPACSGSQAEVSYGPDGAILIDSGVGFPSDAIAHPVDAFVAPHPDAGVPGVPDTGMGIKVDSGTVGSGDTGVPPGTGGACPSTCTKDSECAAACPASPGAVNCCDTVTSACFMSASSTCPDQQASTGGVDSGTGTGGY